MMEDSYPLSPMQQGMLLAHLADPKPGLDVEQLFGELDEDVDAAAFEEAWRRVIARHTILRTRLRWEGVAEPVQEVMASVDFRLLRLNWADPAEAERPGRWAAFLRADQEEGFDLRAAPLMRVTLIREGPRRFRFCWTLHHIIIDGRGIAQTMTELFTLYDALRLGRPTQLPPPQPYRKYIDWLRRADFDASGEFWRGRLRGFESPTPLTIGRRPGAPPAGDDHPRGAHEFRLSNQTTSTLSQLARDNGFTVNTVLQGAWAILLHRYGGGDDVVFGAIRACRRSTFEGGDAVVGMCINTVPVRAKFPPDARLLPWLAELREQWVSIRPHEHAPLNRVQRWSAVPPGTRLFETLFNFQDPSWDQAVLAAAGRPSGLRLGISSRPDFPLVVDAYGGPQIRIVLLYDRTCVDDGAAARMGGHLQVLLEAIAADPQRRVADLPILTEAERRQLLVEWNNTTTGYPRERCIHELFEEQVRRTPDAVALDFADRELTYRELNARANRLARLLQAAGVRRGGLVGICIPRSPEMVVGMLAILKAGGAYLPLDPQYPAERLAFMLQDAGAPVVLTSGRALPKDLAGGARVIDLADDESVISGHRPDDPERECGPEDLAYVIYTSGSTGRPKGTCIPHRGVVRLVKDTDYADLTADHVFLQFAPVSFDASTFEIWGSLLNGALLAIFPPHTPSLQELGRFIMDRKVTTLWLTAALFKLMVEENDASLAGVKQLLAGGDVLPVSAVRDFRRRVPGCLLINGYGPTENTTFTCCHTIADVPPGDAPIPIGRPISNTTAYVLDEFLRLVPVGVPGELFTGGDGLAAGYLNRPELTAERFVPDPFSGRPGARLYRTGDLVRLRPDGVIEFLGRRDGQVKIRGFRIELGEIEAVLRGCDGVADAAVVPLDSPAGRQLAAFVVPKRGAAVDPNAAREFLRGRLPDYMIPASVAAREALPLSPNGKVDRRALGQAAVLPAPQPGAASAPQTPTEEVVAAVWAEVLKVPAVGADADFFGLGGDSLLAMGVCARLGAAFELDLKPTLVFERPVLSQLAEAIDRLRTAGGDRPPEIPRAPRDRPIPLSFYQERIWGFCRTTDDPKRFVAPYRAVFRGRLDVGVLRRALDEILRRHEVLRTTVGVAEGRPVQVIHPPAAFPFRFADFVGTPSARSDALGFADREEDRPFDLAADFPIRAALLRTGPDEHVFLVTIHHLVYGDAIREVFFPELNRLYSAFCRGEASSLPEPPLQYADYSAWQRRNLHPDAELFRTQFSYWLHQLREPMSWPQMPFARAKPPVQDLTNVVKRSDVMPPAVVRALQSVGARCAASLFMVSLAAFKMLLCRSTGRTDIPVGTYVSDRRRPGFSAMMGQTTNLVVLRTDLSGDPTFEDILRRVRNVVLDAHRHQDLPFEELGRAFGERGRSPPAVTLIAMYTAVSLRAFELSDVEVRPFRPSGMVMPWGFTLNVVRTSGELLARAFQGDPFADPAPAGPGRVSEPDGLHAVFVFDSDLYDPAGVEKMSADYAALLTAVAADPSLRLSEPDPPGLR